MDQLRRRVVFLTKALAASVFGFSLAGCDVWTPEPSPIVIATPWPSVARAAAEAVYRSEGGNRPILWVELGSHRWLDASDRRGGIDLILGGPPRFFPKLADAGRLVPIAATDPVAWRQVERPDSSVVPAEPTPAGDPRDDPATFAEAKAVLDAEGWAKGYATLARRPVNLASRANPARRIAKASPEAVALVKTGRHADQARRFLSALTSQGWITSAPVEAEVDARSDDLLADLLGAVLVDARNERRDAQVALAERDQPPFVDRAMGESPPWPPASVAKLWASPTGGPLLDSLAQQIAADPETLEWLKASWQGPKRSIDFAFLREISQASGGRLVREPRFRAWLRGEWTAWTQQLYRRVARLAGGYRPS